MRKWTLQIVNKNLAFIKYKGDIVAISRKKSDTEKYFIIEKKLIKNIYSLIPV